MQRLLVMWSRYRSLRTAQWHYKRSAVVVRFRTIKHDATRVSYVGSLPLPVRTILRLVSKAWHLKLEYCGLK
jgi:hypothetical protein